MDDRTVERDFLSKSKLLGALTARPGVVIIFGAVDTGKTTLVREIALELAQKEKTALIDLDVGQSSVGPPACVGACMVKESLPPWTRAEKLHFVGNFSPRGHFLQILGGLFRLLQWAKSRDAAHILIDTSGFIEGGAAFELKYHKVEISWPTHVILLEKNRELEFLRNTFKDRTKMETHLLRVTDKVINRTIREREEYRRSSLLDYLTKTRFLTFPLTASGLLNPYSWQIAVERHDLLFRLVGLMDRNGSTSALGVIRFFDPVRMKVTVEAPLDSDREITHLQLGKIRLPAQD
jgi:polynucleotide 5'-kinase involved in rRNA processing